MKRTLLLSVVGLASLFSFSCSKAPGTNSKVDEIIKQAENMTFDELCKKAIEESKSATIKGIGNSSRGKTAGAAFVQYLRTLDPTYDGQIEWSQPKNNSIFTTLSVDYKSQKPEYFMTLIQDGNQIMSKMINTHILKTFIPKEWAEANKLNRSSFPKLLPLQTLNKVFMYNNTGSASFNNAWDFVYKGSSGLFMGINSELVGKNFLYMLTSEKYSAILENAFNALNEEKKAYFQPIIDDCAKFQVNLGLKNANAKYGLAWINLWVKNYHEETDDGPICNELVKKSAVDEFGLIVYSKLRSVQETNESSVNNITVAAYNKDYKGIGGYGYCHYLEVMDTSPYPWTACAFISFMTTKLDGFTAWGKDMGGYTLNPILAEENEAKFHHRTAGGEQFPAKNDRGFMWWAAEDGGALVLEDPEYCAKVALDLSDWIDLTRAGK